MPRNESQAPLFARPGIDVVVSLYQTSARLVYPRFINAIDNRNNFVRVGTEADFNPATPVNQATGIPYQDFQTPFFKDYYPLKRGIGFSVATEVPESEQYGLMAKRAKKMVRAINKSMEADAANFMNLATSTSFGTTPDGLAFASASHLGDGFTYSNILSGNPPLNVSSLALAVQAMMRQPSHTNDPMMFTGPFNLLVPPELADIGNRLVTAQKYPTTPNNDDNWAGSMINEVIVNPYFTSTTAWALVVADSDDNPMVMVNRRNLVTKSQEDIDHDVMKYTATRIWKCFAKDPRGFIYSAGA